MPIDYTEPCVGSTGSQSFLDDIERQMQENNSAKREGREALVLPVMCRFCHTYHKEMQNSSDSPVLGTMEELAVARHLEHARPLIVANTAAEHMVTAITASINNNVAEGYGDVEETANIIGSNEELLARKQAEAWRNAIADANPQSSVVNMDNPAVHLEDGTGATVDETPAVEELIVDAPKKTKVNGTK